MTSRQDAHSWARPGDSSATRPQIAPGGRAAAIEDEITDVDRMDMLTLDMGTAYMSKMTRDSYHRQNRKRGRRSEDGERR